MIPAMVAPAMTPGLLFVDSSVDDSSVDIFVLDEEVGDANDDDPIGDGAIDPVGSVNVL